MSPANERFVWARDVVSAHENHQVLEIGCGAGLLLELLAETLVKGTITGIDRSLPMITRAQKRNGHGVESGRVILKHSNFLVCNLPEGRYDSIIAFNVNFFWKNSTAELALIRSLLKPTGKLFVFYQAPFEIDIQASRPIRETLEKNSFVIEDVSFKKMLPTSAFCVIAKKNNE